MRIATNLNKLCVIALFASVACGGRSKKAPINPPEKVEEAKPQENSLPPEESLPGSQLTSGEKEGIEKEKEDQKVTEETKENTEQDSTPLPEVDPFLMAKVQDKACAQVREKNKMDATKAATFTLWLALCQPEFIKKTRLGDNFTYEDGNWYFIDASTGKANKSVVATYKDMEYDLYTRLGSLTLNRALTDKGVVVSIHSFPLILQSNDTSGKSFNAWTDFPTEAPILELLNEPGAKNLFCQSAQLPPEVLEKPIFIKGELPSCMINQEEWNAEFPTIPPAPAGKTKAESARNEECHQLRIQVAKSGQISSQDLLYHTIENVVPVFSKDKNAEGVMIGNEPCLDSVSTNNVKQVSDAHFEDHKAKTKKSSASRYFEKDSILRFLPK